MYKTIIFDFNGTLIDDCDCCLKILNILCKEYNIPHVSKRKYLSIFTFPVYLYYKELGFDTSFESFKKIGGKFHEYYNKMSYEEVKLFDDVLPLLNELKDKYRLVCLSASMTSTLIKQLKFYNIYDYFTDVIGLSDTYAISKEEVGVKFIKDSNLKPDEIIYVGDSIHDDEVAKAMKVKSILVATGHTNKTRLKKVNPNVIDKLSDIKKYL